MFDTYTKADLACSGIYAIVNCVNGRVYIGQAMGGFRRRWVHHLYELRQGRHHNVELQADWNELGEQSFQFAIVHRFAGFPPGAYYFSMAALERHVIVTADSWLYNATKYQLYPNDDELISFLYTRPYG